MATALNLFLAGCLAVPTYILAHGHRYDGAALLGLLAGANIVAAVLAWRGR